MDTSKEYVEMCQKAKEIQQKVHRSLDGCSFGSVNDLWGHSKQKDKMVWLPRQDQLQDMIGDWKVAYALFDFWKHNPLYFIGDKPYYPFNVFNSLEQCWLAFVMHEKYGKRWGGSDWVVI